MARHTCSCHWGYLISSFSSLSAVSALLFADIPKNILRSYITDIQASQLAKFVGADWRALGRVLSMKEYQLRAIAHDRQTAHDRATEVLHRWRQSVGRYIRISKLFKELQAEPELEDATQLFIEYLRETIDRNSME